LVAHVIGGDKQDGVAAVFIRAIKNACDDGLLERLRHAEMQKPYTYVGRDGKAIKARDLEDQRATARAEAAETSLAALKAENERLRKELKDFEMDDYHG